MPITASRLKIIRRLGPLPGLTRKAPKETWGGAAPRTGQGARRKPSAHRRRLDEKQKLRFNYGVTEAQMRRYMGAARRQPGAVGENLLLLLERRLDNAVFRLGVAPTIRAARQMVVHGHVTVNGRRCDRPSYLVQLGDLVALSFAARERPTLRATAEQEPRLRLPSYLRRDTDRSVGGRVVSMPMRSDVPFPLREALVVAYYAR